MGKTLSRQETYPHLRVFDDVFTLTTGNYVEDVDVDRLMHGAMHGLADGLDPDSAYLDQEQVKAYDKGDTGGTAGIACRCRPGCTSRL